MSDEIRPLDEAIRRSEQRGTYYWYFLAKRGKARRREYLIEARIDVPTTQIEDISAPDGWKIDRVEPARGMLFLRRRQALRDKDLREMFSTLLTFAFERRGRFHSWIHEDSERDLADRFEKRARRAFQRLNEVSAPTKAS